MTVSELLIAVAFGACGYIFQRTMRDIKGVSIKVGKVVALLNRWADTDEKRNQISDLMAGK